jgi:inner membrane protein
LDNVTHTLVGALIGESAAAMAPKATNDRTQATRRTLFLAVAIVGSNLPDSDLLYSIGGDKVAYLLEHRGYTHTAIGALLGSALVLILCAWWNRRSGTALSSRDRSLLALLAILTPLLHIAMDALNSYGVHPWWPIDNRWFYGDSVFIVEPLFWASAATLVFLFRTYVGKAFVVLPLIVALYLAFTKSIVNGGSIAVYVVLVALMLAIGRFTRPTVALAASFAACVIVSIAFAVASREALARVDAAAAQFANWTTLDRVLTPLPMNPLCWDVILVQSQDDRYALRRASASLVPSLRCPTGFENPTTAPLEAVALPDTSFLRWHGEVVDSRERLRSLAGNSCEVAALLRFARAPWFSESDTRRVIGDLRYDREPELGFAELDLTRPPRCPAYVPPWTPPRSDLLGP